MSDDQPAPSSRPKRNRLRAERARWPSRAPVTLENLFSADRGGKVKDLNLIVKADVQGSLEAVEDALRQVEHAEVRSPSSTLAWAPSPSPTSCWPSASRAIIIGFNVRPNPPAHALAEQEGVDIRTYRVIYKVTEDVRAALMGMLKPEFVEQVIGSAEVRQTFKASRLGTIAGCYVTNGKITRTASIRVLRDGAVVFDGRMASLKRFQEDVREVLEGYECGILLDSFNDLKEEDVLEAYETREVARGG